MSLALSKRTILTAVLSDWKWYSNHDLVLRNLEVDFQLLPFCTKLGSRLPTCERQIVCIQELSILISFLLLKTLIL